jgi:hypothetical protein
VALVIAGLAAFALVFVLVDQGYQRLVAAHLDVEAGSAGDSTAYGLVSRMHLVVPLVVLALWRPAWLGLRLGSIRLHRRTLLLILLANCLVVAGVAAVSGGSSSFSGNQWLVTEAVTVPLVEEAMWRGVVFTLSLRAFETVLARPAATALTVWSTGAAFGLLHLGNLFVGVSPGFVVLQAVNATVWGVAYGYTRALTGSIWPAVVMHAAMNAGVVLLT